jgi:hypothetical protein
MARALEPGAHENTNRTQYTDAVRDARETARNRATRRLVFPSLPLPSWNARTHQRTHRRRHAPWCNWWDICETMSARQL